MYLSNSLKLLFLLAIMLLFSPKFSQAQHDHSHHGEENITVDANALGKVNFPISADAETQHKFERGLALLHHMMYVQAEQKFSALAEEAPDCAMAYWGMAMTIFQPLWAGEPNEEKLKKGLMLLAKAKEQTPLTERELAYIDAAAAFFKNWENLNYRERIAQWEAAQKALYEKYPDDIDAAALYALSHLATAPKTDQEFTHQKAAGVILDKLFEREPEHPGVLHYTIHAYDNPALAERAVAASRAYDKIAPDVPHALHMPTHIFVRLGIWPDAVSWNIRSAKAALKYPSHGFVSHHFPHALDYLIYAYLQMGDDENAKDVLKQMQETSNYQQTFVSAYALAAIPARWALERHQWKEAAAVAERYPADFPWEKFPAVEPITYFARGLGAARSGDIDAAVSAKKKLDELYQKVESSGQKYWAIIADAQRKTVAAWIAYASGEVDNGIQLMQEAADLEDSVDKHPITPGAVLPARELLGDMLLHVKRYADALAAYEASLKISHNRFNSLLGAAQTAELSGDLENAKKYYSMLAEISTDSKNSRSEIEKAKLFLANQ